MLQEPALSPYDWQFNLFGIPVRVTWLFWVLAAVIGWSFVQYVDERYASLDLNTPGAAALLAVFAGCLFLSILVHELGHSAMHLWFGMDTRIVLYHFGGLAIPGSFTQWNAARKRFTDRPGDQILISLAGPVAQMLFALVIWIFATMAGIDTSASRLLREWIDLPFELERPSSAIVYVATDALIFRSAFWALLNLLPMMPLDGGNIMRELLRVFQVRDEWRIASMVSMVVAGLMAWYCFNHGETGGGLMCLGFIASNYEIYQRSGFMRY